MLSIITGSYTVDHSRSFHVLCWIKISEYFSVYYQCHTIKAGLITSTALDFSSPLELLRKEALNDPSLIALVTLK